MYKKEKVKLTPKEVEENIAKIDGSMALEEMPLPKEIKDNIRACLMGKSTTKKECQKVIERYKQIYG